MSPSAPDPQSEGGFTLPEILITVTLLALIVVPLTNSFFAGFRSVDKTAQVLVTSSDRQLLSVYFPPDVLSASTVVLDDDTSQCAAGVLGDGVVRFNWREFDGSATTTYVADYRLVTTGVRTALVRYSCTAGGSPTALNVVHNLVAPFAQAAQTPTQVSITVTDLLATTYTVTGTRRTA